MNLRSPRLWLGVFSALGVGALLVGLLGESSPGELSAVHAREPKLSGFGSCSNCHGGWTSTMTAACLECHPRIDEQIEGGHGLHGVLGPEKAQACAACHSEHHGGGFPIVNRRSFALAGIEDTKHFDHALLGWPMEGRHLELGCADCHPNADVAELPAGATRYLGLDRDCASCHQDPHQGRMAEPCAACHSQRSFAHVRFVDHDQHLPLVGPHAVVPCRTCHDDRTPHALEAQVATSRKPPARQCIACHTSPHRPGFAAGERNQDCSVCHQPLESDWSEVGEITPAQHLRAGFALAPPHHEVACAHCHPREQSSFAARYPGRTADDCAACHQDPHGGQFAGDRCVGCHERSHFVPHAYTVEDHARSLLPLLGSHLTTSCEDCHQRPEPEKPRAFRGTSARCDGCHADAHHGFFAPHQAVLDQPPHGACAHCHDSTRFRELPRPFAHDELTPFPLQGAHRTAACEDCHRRREQPDELGRSFGSIRELLGAVRPDGQGCVACHQDPHQGHFDRAGVPPNVEGRVGCDRCHDAVSFRALPNGFDHGTWTGFPLLGAHAAAACSACHPPRAADAHGRTWEPARGNRCADCHADPHQGQFQGLQGTDCQRCHAGPTAWRNLVFRHDLHSRFKLGTAHQALACNACHHPVRQGEVEFVRYKPLGSECVDCHGNQNDPLRRHRPRKE